MLIYIARDNTNKTCIECNKRVRGRRGNRCRSTPVVVSSVDELLAAVVTASSTLDGLLTTLFVGCWTDIILKNFISIIHKDRTVVSFINLGTYQYLLPYKLLIPKGLEIIVF